MKKISLILMLSLMFVCTSVNASEYDNAPVLETYNWKFTTQQGTDGWYYCMFANGMSTEMTLNADKTYWSDSSTWARISNNGRMMPTTNYDVGMIFRAPKKGMVRIKNEGNLYFNPGAAYAASDGVNVSIIKSGGDVLWSKLVKWGETPSYDLVTPVREGQEIQFIMNINKSSGYDDVTWKPSVLYIDAKYEGAGGGEYTYFERTGGRLRELQYDSLNDTFRASNGTGFISAYDMLPTSDTSFVKRYIVQEDGRYRINGNFKTFDERGSGTVLTVYRNNKEFWRQLLPENTENDIDIRLMADKNDIIDMQFEVCNFSGFNYAEYTCEVKKFAGTIPTVQASTSVGNTYYVYDEIPLSSLIGSVQDSGARYYVEKNDVRYLMDKYTSNIWSSSADNTLESVPCSISSREVKVGANDAIIEVDVQKTGTMKFTGTFGLSSASDGMLIKVYKNDEMIWSNRVGGERSVRWDEPYDVSYFLNELNAVTKVNKGDVISFRFNRWRLHSNDTAIISDIKMSYISEDSMSKTTEWKLTQSNIIDTHNNCAYINGQKMDVDIFVEDGTTYISEKDMKLLFSKNDIVTDRTINGINYYKLRNVAVHNEKQVVWAANRLIITHSFIETFFGYPELREIEAAISGGELFE